MNAACSCHSRAHTCANSRNTYYWQQLAEHYRVPSFHSLFSQLNTEITWIYLLVRCEMKPKKMLSSSGNAVVRDAFLVHCFFYLSGTHAPIFHRSMRMLWMQRNICIAAATFNMIAMSSARFACALSAVKPKQTRSHLLRTSTLRHIPPLASLPPLSSRRFYWWLSDTGLCL